MDNQYEELEDMMQHRFAEPGDELPPIVAEMNALDREQQEAWELLQMTEEIARLANENFIAVSTKRTAFIEESSKKMTACQWMRQNGYVA